MGKTALIEELAGRGHRAVPDVSRELIWPPQADAKDKKRYMELLFQKGKDVFEKASQEFINDPFVFFEGGFMEALCYAAQAGLPIAPEMKTYAETHRYRTDVFILPPWRGILPPDAQQPQEWNATVFTYNKMIQTYRSFGYDPMEIPKAPVSKRADFVLDHIKKSASVRIPNLGFSI